MILSFPHARRTVRRAGLARRSARGCLLALVPAAVLTAAGLTASAQAAPTGTTLAYVANGGDNTVSVINTATNAITATIPVGPRPQLVAVTPDHATAYVTDFGGTTVSVINTLTDTVTATIPVGPSPLGVAFTPDGSTAYVANNGAPRCR